MKEKFYIGIVQIHEKNIVIEDKRKKKVKAAIEEKIEEANKKFPNFDFHPGVRIYKGRRVK